MSRRQRGRHVQDGRRQHQAAHRGLQLRAGGLPELGARGVHQGGPPPGPRLDAGDHRGGGAEHGELWRDKPQGQEHRDVDREGTKILRGKTSLLALLSDI